MKQTFKKLVVFILVWQVKRLRKKHQFKIVGVSGSIGKTSTKLAIAQVLGKSLRVRYQDGNYNDIVTVPLIFFGQSLPSLTNLFAWLKVFLNNQRQIKSAYPYDVVVLELGTDKPGEIASFKRYIDLDIAVITAITPEHMEAFGDMKAVANEELAVTAFAKQTIYNADLVPEEFRTGALDTAQSYSIAQTSAGFHLANIFHSAGGFEGDIKHNEEIYLHVVYEVISQMQLYSLLAAVITAKELGLKTSQITNGIASIHPVSGRLRRLRGINNSTIIDDTYNASPETVKAGINTLYAQEAAQRIVVLGSMNELGSLSEAAHREVGSLCDPSKLALVVTIGAQANSYIAPEAETKGCTVKKFDSPYEAGEYLQTKIEAGAAILVKGSQNGVFAEEAVKLILADPEDASKLVRQSPEWIKKKRQQFKAA